VRRLGGILSVVLCVGWLDAAAGTLVPTPIGVGPLFHPGATSASVARALPVGSLTCTRNDDLRFGVHLELFARGRVVIVPAGIGIAPPLRRRDAYVVSGSCSYPVRSREPTGVIEVARSSHVRLGELFAVWGQPLAARRLVGFRARRGQSVRAYVDGRRFHGGVRSIRLRRHAEIVLELGRYIPPHTSYRFRKGL
jgi:hypothetical protein